MKRLNKVNIRVLLLLLMYIGQSLFTCVSAAPMSSSATDPVMNASHCHGHSESMAVDFDADREAKPPCCTGECSMLNCHNVSIALNSVNFPSVVLVVARDFLELSISPVRTASSFYRPPIHG